MVRRSLSRALRDVQPTTWLLLSGFVSLCVAGALIVGTMLVILRSAGEREAMERIDTRMRIAWHVLHDLGPDIRVIDGLLTAGDTVLDGNTAVVDTILALGGDTATIFRDDVRVSTNMRTPGGGRAYGTHLAVPEARHALLERHAPFRGIVNEFGTPYYIGYDPVFDPDGTLVGILAVGTPESQVLRVVNRHEAVVIGIPLAAVVGVAIVFLVFGRRFTRQIRYRQRLAARARTQLDTALANMANGLTLWDPSGKLMLFNARASEIWGLPPGQLTTGMTFRDFYKARDAVGALASEDWEAEYAAGCEIIERRQAAVRDVASRNGRMVTTMIRPMADGGWVATYNDVTEQHKTAAKVEFMASHDALTGLGNRVLFDQRLQGALADARVDEGKAGSDRRRLAVLSLDLDRFKAVNDTLGHAAGDKLLVAVGRRLATMLRSTDTLARLGGDEFAVVLPSTDPGVPACGAFAERVIRRLSDPFMIEGQPVSIDGSIGVALFPDHGDTAAELLRCADIAMYRAKQDGRNRHCVFEPVMDEQLQKRRALERDLREAVAAETLILHYQPLVCCTTGAVQGYEALLRWHHPVHGPISPAVFVPLAEETNLILTLSRWVLETACRAAVQWPEPARVAVNLAAAQFRELDLAATVLDTLDRTGLPPDRLEVEITEGVLIDDPARAMAMLSELRACGVRVSLDDFGTGYSSLSYLRQFPLDKIKIDKSFIDTMTVDPQAASIVQALVGLAHTLHLTVTAEGVETTEQLHALQAQSCNQVQGYLLGRPAPSICGPVITLPAALCEGMRYKAPGYEASVEELVLAHAS